MTVRHGIYSDHRALVIKLRIASSLAKQHDKNENKRVSRLGLQDPVLEKEFTEEIMKSLLDLDNGFGESGPYNHNNVMNGKSSLQESFQEILDAAAKKVLTDVSRSNPGWFTANHDVLIQSCQRRNSLQQKYNLDPRPINKRKLREQQSAHKRLVAQSRRDWIMKRISKVNGTGGAFIGHYWKAVNDISKGCDQTTRVVPLMFTDPTTNEKCKTEKDVGRVLYNHLDVLLNATPSVEEQTLESVQQRDMQTHMDDPPSKDEIVKAIRRQNNGKACGKSNIPAEFYKACARVPALLDLMQNIITRAWNEEKIPKEWIEGKIKMLPKDGNLLDPGRWRSITLLDAMAKIMSTILTNRANEILAVVGLDMQNGFTPGRGTTDGSFCVRSLLRKRKEHGLETYGYFLDLVKAFDTVPRKSLLRVLKKFGMPPNMVRMIKNMYTNCTITVEVGKDEYDINATAGVKQGDNLAPVLFVIYIQAVLETLEAKFPQRKKLLFSTKFDHIIHGRQQPVTVGGKNPVRKGYTVFDVTESLYADDAYFGFQSRADLEEGAPIIDRHFTAFGLQVHRGKILPNGKRKKSKTECMYNPAQGAYEDGDTSDVIVDGGFYTFTKTFKYLGSIITYDLTSDADIAYRIRNATGAFAKVKKTLTSRKIKLEERSAIYVVIVVSILLFGSESWSLRKDLLHKLEVFHNNCVRQMCHVSRFKQWKKKIRTTTLNKMVGLTNIEQMQASRQLRWAGHVARMKNTRAPKKLLTSFVRTKRPVGAPKMTFGRSLKNALKQRANAMTVEQLEKQFDVELDANRTFTTELNHNVNGLTRITGYEFRDALLRTTNLKRAQKNKLTWIDFVHDRDIWRMVVLNKFNTYSLLHPMTFRRNIIDTIVPIPLRPERRLGANKLPKLYAIWYGAATPNARPTLLHKIVDSWTDCKPMVFKVPGAQYISATNNAAGRTHLEAWLMAHQVYPGTMGIRVTLRKDGKRYYYNRD